MLVSSIASVRYALLVSNGIKPSEDVFDKMLAMYESVLNHRAYLPDAFDQFAKDKSAWGKENLTSALAEVASWEE